MVEIKAHGPVDRLNGVITQMHGQANEVAFEKEGMVVTIDGSERLIGRLDVLPRNCRKFTSVLQIVRSVC